jgi:ankyrin repeat protein
MNLHDVLRRKTTSPAPQSQQPHEQRRECNEDVAIVDGEDSIDLDYVKALVASHPESLLFLDNDVCLPIHVAVGSNAPYEVIEILVAACPSSLVVGNMQGLTPLDLICCFWCCRKAGNKRVIDLFLTTDVDCISYRDSDGRNSFHRVFEHGPQCALSDYCLAVEYLCGLDENRTLRNMSQPDNLNQLPLITLLYSTSAPTVNIHRILTVIIRKIPWVAGIESATYGFLMHQLLNSRLMAPTELHDTEFMMLFDMILTSYPSSIRRADPNGASPSVRCLLSKKYALSRSILEANGIIECGGVVECSKIVTDRDCPEDLRTRVLDKFLAGNLCRANMLNLLISILRDGGETGVVTRILEDRPMLLSIRTGDGNLALHIAILERCDPAVIGMLVEVYPGALLELDSYGRLPLNQLIIRQLPKELILKCLKLAPTSVMIKDSSNEIALHAAMVNRAASEIINLIVDLYPVGLQMVSSRNDLPLHIALSIPSISDDVIVRIVSLYPEACRTKNSTNDLPLHIAVRLEKSVRIIESITDVFSNAIVAKDLLGCAPIHLAFGGPSVPTFSSNERRTALILMFIRMNSIAAGELNAQGLSILHYAVQDRGLDSFQLVEKIVDCRRESASIRSLSENLPIHFAVLSDAGHSIRANLIAAFPDGLSAKNRDGDVPLHIAVRNQKNVNAAEAVLQLIEAYPSAAHILDNNKELPVHCALRLGASAIVISRLLDANPSSLRCADADKDLPLHRGLEVTGTDEDVIIRMVQMQPTSCQKRNRRGDLPLHDAIRSGKSVRIVVAVVEVFPDAIVIADNEGWNPIHLVTSSRLYRNEVKASIVLLFLRLSAKAASMRNGVGFTILHIVVQDRAFDPFDLVENILSVRAEAASVCTNNGDLPIHLAVQSKATVAIIRSLIAAFPDGLKMKDRDGDLPLHFAVRNSCYLEEIDLLISSHPLAVCVQNKDRELPLHYALRFGLPATVINRLLDASPDSVKVTDREGNLPLHCGLEMAATTTEIILRMVHMFPESCRRKNVRGDLPLHDALRINKGQNVIEVLTELHADAILIKDKQGYDPLHLVLQQRMSHSHNKQQQASIIMLLLRLRPKAGTLKNGAGLCALHAVVQDRGFDPYQICENIIALCPESVSMTSASGDLPIHFAVQSGAPISVKAALLSAFPDGLKIPDREGSLPLHFAVRNNRCCSLEEISLLIDGYPNAVNVQDKEKELPLHYALRSSMPTIILHRLLDAGCDCLKIADKNRAIPLHIGLEVSSTPDEILTRITRMWPDGCKRKNTRGDLALHDAVRSGKSSAVIQSLTDIYPDAIIIKDNEGFSPIHLVVSGRMYSKHQQAAIILLFVQANSKALTVQNEEGLALPHLVVLDRQMDDLHVLETLLSSHKECASVKCRRGDLPIHYAVQSRAPRLLIAALIAVYPDGLRTKDREGDLPLHCAARRTNCSIDEVEQLTAGSGKTVLAEAKDGFIPVFELIKNRAFDGFVIRLIAENVIPVSLVDRHSSYLIKVMLDSASTASLPSSALVLTLAEDNFRGLAAVAADGVCAFPLLCQHWDAYSTVCTELLDRYPQLAAVSGRDRQTGLHKLLKPGGDYDNASRRKLMSKWIEVDSKMLLAKDDSGNTPASYVVLNSSSNPNVNLLRLMLYARPELVTEGHGLGNKSLLELALDSHPVVFGELLGNGAPVLAESPSLYERSMSIVGPRRIVTTFRGGYWIKKKGGLFGIWRLRYFKFLLLASTCFYFCTPTDNLPKGMIGLQLATINKRPDLGVGGFELCCRNNGRTYLLQAANTEEFENICSAFQACINAVSS